MLQALCKVTGGVLIASDVVVARLMRTQGTEKVTGTFVAEVITDVAHSSRNPL